MVHLFFHPFIVLSQNIKVPECLAHDVVEKKKKNPANAKAKDQLQVLEQ